ncbi:MAG: hypothetical protein ACREBU_26045, partial [Nitrososphaera sp.]
CRVVILSCWRTYPHPFGGLLPPDRPEDTIPRFLEYPYWSIFVVAAAMGTSILRLSLECAARGYSRHNIRRR